MLVNIAVNFLGLVIFLFVFWKRLKEDYAGEIVFKAAFYILSGVTASAISALKFAPEWFFWLEFAGLLSGLALAVIRLKIKFYEAFESSIISVLPWISLIFLKDSVINSSLTSFFGFLTTLVIVFAFYYFDQHYRQFVWYGSGKVGFAGLASLALTFLIRASLAVSGSGVLSFVDKYEVAFSATAASLCFLMIFNLGRSNR